MKNILLAIDFDDEGGKLINMTLQIAEKFGSKVWLIHIAAPDPEFIGYDVGPQYIRNSRAEDLRQEHKQLQKLSDEFGKKGINSEGLLIQGPTVKMILDETEKLNIDLIILGHREHSFLYNTFFGSTATEVIVKSKIPLLVIPLEKSLA